MNQLEFKTSRIIIFDNMAGRLAFYKKTKIVSQIIKHFIFNHDLRIWPHFIKCLDVL